jgi:GH15 family glucan-1,4-alpha-glucosidase
MATLIATYEYVLYSGDMAFLTSNWAKTTLAIDYIAAKIDSTGMLDVTATEDWGRHGQGGHNTEANALLYRTLVTGCALANWTNNASLGTKWASQAETLKAAVMKNNWDSVVG